MKFIIILILFQLFISDSQAQKEDYVWIFGFDNSPPIGNNETYYFDFNQGSSPKGMAGLSPLWIRGNNASICDAEGHLLFYTNGCHVADANHDIMPNGSGINEGEFIEEFRQDTCINYPGLQDLLFLNDPGNNDGYYLIHKRIRNESNFPRELNYSYIDKTLNGGLGDISDKNQTIADSIDFMYNYLTAIHHANGVDWWLLQLSQDEKIYFYLINNAGIELSHVEIIDTEFVINSSGSGTAKFSPDGEKYAFFNPYNNLFLYDFDREFGDLDNLQTLEILNTPNNVPRFSSIEWSPNSRFLYIASEDVLYQIDTWEDNLEDGLVLIDTWNGVQDPFNTTFVLMASAPDCKIYMCSGSGTFSYHVINKPNEKGVACDFVQQGIRLPFVSATATMPNFPRFRVDEEDKCNDAITSIFGDQVFYRRDMHVYPNPVRDILNIEIPEGHRGRIVVIDMMGQLVWSGDSDRYSGEVQIDLSLLAVGTYSVEFLPNENRERLVYTAQVVRVE